MFALCHLLGFRFAPRIPNIAGRRLHLFVDMRPGPDIAPLAAQPITRPYRRPLERRNPARRLDPHPLEATTRMLGLVRSGLLRLDDYVITAFGLDDANEAVAHAAAVGGPFRLTVIRA